MRVLIVEDETAAADNLAYLLRKYDPAIEIAANTESVEETVEWLRSNRPADIIFMDIQLSDGSAFEIFDRIEVRTPVIFTTAYDQYAIDAFKVNSIDYLLKPIKPVELTKALNKFLDQSRSHLFSQISSLNITNDKLQYPRSILVTEKDKLIPVTVNDIAYIYSTNKHTCIVTDDSHQHGISKSLDQLISTLDPQIFIRANKQFIISRNAIRDITIWFDSRLRITLNIDTPEPIYISKNRVADFKSWLTI